MNPPTTHQKAGRLILPSPHEKHILNPPGRNSCVHFPPLLPLSTAIGTPDKNMNVSKSNDGKPWALVDCSKLVDHFHTHKLKQSPKQLQAMLPPRSPPSTGFPYGARTFVLSQVPVNLRPRSKYIYFIDAIMHITSHFNICN